MSTTGANTAYDIMADLKGSREQSQTLFSGVASISHTKPVLQNCICQMLKTPDHSDN